MTGVSELDCGMISCPIYNDVSIQPCDLKVVIRQFNLSYKMFWRSYHEL